MDPTVRERLLEAALTQLDEVGRGAMELGEVLGEAGISEADFGEFYPDLDACLDDAWERLTFQLDAAMVVGCSTGGDWTGRSEPEWPERVRAALEAVLAELAGAPALARALTRGYPSLGTRQQARYQAFVERFATHLRGRRDMAGVDGDLPGEVDALAVGAAEAIVFEEIDSGRVEELPEMTASILFSVLVPYLGATAAGAEMEKAEQSR